MDVDTTIFLRYKGSVAMDAIDARARHSIRLSAMGASISPRGEEND